MCLVLNGLIAFAQPSEAILPVDTTQIVVEADSLEQTKRIHLPRKATMYSAVLPGLGQVYNHQAWKVPFVYGGFVALGLTIKWNQDRYVGYKRSYIELNDKNPETRYYENYIDLSSYTINENSVSSDLNSRFMGGINLYSRQRNIFIIATAAFYLLNVLDANVNAHFIDFDISEDLSLNLMQMESNPLNPKPAFGATLSYNF
ncbi:MAG: hypothetical protein JW735_03200 [Prolixibacteraceae bacterium]|nr:hypothetical protein [Prolixibacteraceae bacterium]